MMLRFLGAHLAIGVVVGLALTAGLYAVDAAGLRTLVAATREGWLALAILAFAMAATFGALAMGAGVMLHPRDDHYGQRAGRRTEDDRPQS